MCGIVYVQRKDNKPAFKQVLKRYKAQKGRGSDGFGYIGIKQSQRATEAKRFMFEHEVEKALQATKLSTILFHHRYPTSTPNVPESAHPIRVVHDELQYEYQVVHNGVISNDEALKEAHEKLGYKYTTQIQCQLQTRKGVIYPDGVLFNDSEALAIELARNIEGLTERVAAKGSIAYIVLQLERDTKRAVAMYYGTNGGNSLTVEETKDFIVIASQGGKAINDNICYRVSLPDNTVTEYLQVQVPTVYTAPASKPYGFTLSSGVYEDDEFERPRKGFATPKAGNGSSTDKTLLELQEEIGDVQDEIIGIQADLEYARQEGDSEEEEVYQQEFRDLVARLNKLNDLYAQQANRQAATA